MPQNLGERNSKRGSKRKLDCFGGEISSSNSKKMKPICPKLPKFVDINQNYLPKEQHPQPSGFITMKTAKELVKAGLYDLKNSLLARKSTGLLMKTANNFLARKSTGILIKTANNLEDIKSTGILRETANNMVTRKSTGISMRTANTLAARKSTAIPMETANNLVARKSTEIPMKTAKEIMKEALKEFKSCLVVIY